MTAPPENWHDSVSDLTVELSLGDACTLVYPREPTEQDFALHYRRAL